MISKHLLGNLTFPEDPSLDQYRKRGVQFNHASLYEYYYEVGLEFYNEFKPIFRSCKTLSHTNTVSLTIPERRRLILQQIAEIKPKWNFTRKSHAEMSLRGFVLGKMLFSFDMSFCTRLGVHSTLYIDSLLSLGTEKHIGSLDRAYSVRDFGCFAMTELGHGSNVAQLGTTATFIKETREFEVHTPDSLAAKWWIGAAAQTANKCVVFAQLILDGESKGIHAFLVDLRDQETHSTKQGVIIGDCGPKFENDGIDNGFIIFKNYRVPYDALLDRISQITAAGEFVSQIDKKEKRLGRMLSSLIRGRTSVSSCSEVNLKHSLTIAIRWAAIRKQFGPPNSPEVSILDYQLTRTRLMPHLGNLFASSAACEFTFLRFDSIKDMMAANPECNEGVEYHAILSAFKVLTSEWAFKGIHECRRVCGGIGYSSFNKLGELLAKQDVNLTWEGDNYVLLQQTSAFIIKHVQRLMLGKKIDLKSLNFIEIDYETISKKKAGRDYLEVSYLLEALKQVFNINLHRALLRLQENAGTAANLFETWNITQPSLQSLGQIFGIVLISEQMSAKVSKLQGKCQVLYGVIYKLTQLFLADKLIQYSSDLLISEYFTKIQFEELEEKFYELCTEVGESCVNIVDAIADEDFMHGSCIGFSDGQAYRRMTEAVEAQPDCYQDVLCPDLLRKITTSIDLNKA